MLGLAAVPAPSLAQGLGAIAGVARDASGGVLPGVTVEVASPALIEKVRSAVTDGNGQYRVLSLPNGIYSVTFTLPGFGTVKRDGLEVLSNFTATANADLTVGAVTETVTVTGESPVVDVQSAATLRALTDQNFKEIPSGGTWTNLAGLIPAVNVGSVPDVGGTSGDPVQATLTAHGSTAADQNQMIDGIKIGNVLVGGARTNLSVSPLLFDEVNVTFAGQSAEYTTNGVQSNAVPKSGGNTFHGTALVSGSSNTFQSDNLTDRLRGMGLTSSNTFKSLYDVNGAIGGPIIVDRLWFYGTARHNVNKANIAGLFQPTDPNAIQRTDNRGEPAYSDIYFRDFTGRVTAQLTSKQKVTGFAEYQPKCDCTYQISGNKAPEASAITKWPIVLIQGSYTNVVTNRILIEAGVGYSDASYTIYPQLGLPQASPTDPFTIQPGGIISSTSRPISIVEQGGGALALPPLTYRAGGNGATSNSQDDTLKQVASRAAVSYTTGSHSFKVGMDGIYGYIIRRALNYNGFIQYRTRDYVPNQLTLYAPSAGIRSNGNGLGLFAQDRWTVNRMTVNAGVRLDFMNEWNDPWSTSTSPSPWLPNRPVVNFGKIENVPNWKDINPRLGFSYDLFGNGKTAIKASANRAVSQDVITMATNNNPGQTIATNTARNWTDNDRDFVPDCNLTNPLAQGPTLTGALNTVDTCGQNLNANFGTAVPATTYDPAILNGWGVRPYNWEFSAGVQQEILPRLSASISYFRRIQGNFTVTDNVLTTAADYRQVQHRRADRSTSAEFRGNGARAVRRDAVAGRGQPQRGDLREELRQAVRPLRRRRSDPGCPTAPGGPAGRRQYRPEHDRPLRSDRQGPRIVPRARRGRSDRRGRVDAGRVLSPGERIRAAIQGAVVLSVAVVRHPDERDDSEYSRSDGAGERDLHRSADCRRQPTAGSLQRRGGRSGVGRGVRAGQPLRRSAQPGGSQVHEDRPDGSVVARSERRPVQRPQLRRDHHADVAVRDDLAAADLGHPGALPQVQRPD